MEFIFSLCVEHTGKKPVSGTPDGHNQEKIL